MTNPLFDSLFAPPTGRGSAFLILPDGREMSGDSFLRLVARQAHALRACGVAVKRFICSTQPRVCSNLCEDVRNFE